MCPVCIATSLALVAGTLTAGGGLTALVAKTLHRKGQRGGAGLQACGQSANDRALATEVSSRE